jgi:hypothetical protein
VAKHTPSFEVVGDAAELSDAAISALAALLLDIADRARETCPHPSSDLVSQPPGDVDSPELRTIDGGPMTATLSRTPVPHQSYAQTSSASGTDGSDRPCSAAWPLVAAKELLDNALDACEEAGTPPEIALTVDDAGIMVEDNGPGIPATTVSSILDFSSRTSSREAYAAPDRGAQGNALKTLAAMPYVLDGECGRIEIWSQAIHHDISIRVDPIRQEPVVDHRQTACSGRFVKNGTCVRLHWPNSPSPAAGAGAPPSQPSSGDLEETTPGDGYLPSSLLRAAKPRFYKLPTTLRFSTRI